MDLTQGDNFDNYAKARSWVYDNSWRHKRKAWNSFSWEGAPARPRLQLLINPSDSSPDQKWDAVVLDLTAPATESSEIWAGKLRMEHPEVWAGVIRNEDEFEQMSQAVQEYVRQHYEA